jgi:hypothetical protein
VVAVQTRDVEFAGIGRRIRFMESDPDGGPFNRRDHMTKPKRIDRALQLRDHALSILRQHGSYQSAGDAKFLTYRGDPFGLMLRTPFQKWSEPNEAAKKLAAINSISIDHARYAAALHGLELPEVLPYGIDIWRGKRSSVLNGRTTVAPTSSTSSADYGKRTS